MICGRDRSVATPWFMKSNQSWNFLETLNSTYSWNFLETLGEFSEWIYFYFSQQTLKKLSDIFWTQLTFTFHMNFELKSILKLLGNSELNLLLLFTTNFEETFRYILNSNQSWNFLETLNSTYFYFSQQTSWKLTFTFRDKVETNFLMKHEL